MARQMCRGATLALLFALFQSTSLLAHLIDNVWEQTNTQEYGFSMHLNPGSHIRAVQAPEFDDGWTRLSANVGGVFFLGLAGTDVEVAPAQLDTLRDTLTNLPEMTWEVIDEGEDVSGWKWFRTFRTSMYGDSFIGGYGAGEKDSYIFLLQTSDGDFETHSAGYANWFESISLDE
jgi:hypothetical protein